MKKQIMITMITVLLTSVSYANDSATEGFEVSVTECAKAAVGEPIKVTDQEAIVDNIKQANKDATTAAEMSNSDKLLKCQKEIKKRSDRAIDSNPIHTLIASYLNGDGGKEGLKSKVKGRLR